MEVIYSMTVMWLVCALFFIRTISYSSDIINCVNIYKIILVVICDYIIVLIITLS